MKMDTLMVVPKEKDLPLYSYDRIYALGNDTLIVELYDTISGVYNLERLRAVKDEYSDLTERDPGVHWYDEIKLAESVSKKGKKAHTERLNELTVKHFEGYLEGAVGQADANVKQRKTAYYVNGLLTNGGPSTDVFKKCLGEEKTEKLFRKVLFGTEL